MSMKLSLLRRLWERLEDERREQFEYRLRNAGLFDVVTTGINSDPGHRSEIWGNAMREDFEERASIMEFDGGLDRITAELEVRKIVTLNGSLR